MVMRVTKEQIKEMKELRKKGMSYSKISLILLIREIMKRHPLNLDNKTLFSLLKLRIGEQTVMYHLNNKYREKIKIYSLGKKPRNRKKYMRNYQQKRYSLDSKFREKQKEASRKNWRKKHE